MAILLAATPKALDLQASSPQRCRMALATSSCFPPFPRQKGVTVSSVTFMEGSLEDPRPGSDTVHGINTEANWTHWIGYIEAVRMAVQSCESGDDLTVGISLLDLVNLFDSDFANSNGRDSKCAAAGRTVLQLAKSRDIRLTVVHAPEESIAKAMKKAAKTLGYAKLREAGQP